MFTKQNYVFETEYKTDYFKAIILSCDSRLFAENLVR